jgi:hypothetical protein
MAFHPKEVNEAFAIICPELKSKYAVYPVPEPYNSKWLAPNSDFEKKPCYIDVSADQGLIDDYVYCKHGPNGKGYYHVLTKMAYTNLYSRLSAEGPGTTCCGFFGDRKRADQWDTARLIVYNRSRCNRPDDEAAKTQAIDHMVGTSMDQTVGLKL